MSSSKRPPDSSWVRSPSKRLVRKPRPDYNFKFLQLPTEIKLRICEYLSVDDIRRLSFMSEGFNRLFNKYFVCKQIHLPNDLLECADIQGRYVLSIKVDFSFAVAYNHKDSVWYRKPISPVTRAKCVEAIKLLNLSQLKEIVLKTDLISQWLKGAAKGLCTWYTEIASIVFTSALHLQHVDISLLRCKKSLLVMETLANNASSLKHVTVRNSANFGTNSSEHNKINPLFPHSPLSLVRNLLDKCNITSLYLLNFELYEYQEYLLSDPRPSKILESSTLKELFMRFASCPGAVLFGSFINETLICPALTQLRVEFKDYSDVCLYHFSDAAPAFICSMFRNSPKCKRYNGKYMFKGKFCCYKSCPLYQYYYSESD